MTSQISPSLTIHTVANAPAGSRETLAAVEKMFGGVLPNLFGILGGSPELLTSAATINGLLGKISLGALEQQVVELVVSRENRCDYCLAAHRFLSRRLDQGEIEAAATGTAHASAKLAVLDRWTTELVTQQGRISAETRAAFVAAGYGEQQALEVILVTGLKTMHNLVNNYADTPVDTLFTAPAK